MANTRFGINLSSFRCATIRLYKAILPKFVNKTARHYTKNFIDAFPEKYGGNRIDGISENIMDESYSMNRLIFRQGT